jgi:Zn-dependent oligopeptidase
MCFITQGVEYEVWHEDVRFFHVKDASTGEHVASFFLDPYSRCLHVHIRMLASDVVSFH